MSETNQEMVDTSVDKNTETQTPETEVDDKLTDNEVARLSDDDFDAYYSEGKLPSGFIRDKVEKSDDGEENNTPQEVDTDSEGADDIDDGDEEGDTSSDPDQSDQDEPDEDEEDKKTVKDSKTKESNTDQKIDYEKAYKEALAPLKAVGKEIEIKSLNELRQLAQMGIDYTKKMQTIKPVRKVFETLEKAGIDEKELNFLIDVSKGNKDALTELLKRHSVDPMDIDITKEEKYTPSNHMVSDSEIEFQSVMDEIKQSGQLDKVMNVTSKIWDSESKSLLLTRPDLLRGLLDEINMGRFDMIQGHVERKKLFGQTQGKPDIALYIETLDELAKASNPTPAQKQVVQTPAVKKQVDETVDKKKAAPLKSKGSANTSSITKQQLLSMSDEEFEKMSQATIAKILK